MDRKPATGGDGREHPAGGLVDCLATVVVPTHNRASFLPDAVRSALNQTHRRLEIVIVDDGSDDSTPRVCAALAAEDARVVWLRQENRGLSGARNTGLGVARGEWVLFLDDDDFLEPDCVEVLLESVGSRGGDAIAGRGRSFFAPAGSVSGEELQADPSRFHVRPIDDRPAPACVTLEVLLVRSPFPTHAALLRTRKVRELDGFDEQLGVAEDLDFWIRLVERTGPVPMIDRPLVWYRDHRSQMSRRIGVMARTVAGILEAALARHPDLGSRKQVRRRIASLRREEAYAALLEGDGRGARRAALRSLGGRPGAPKTWAYLAFSTWPSLYRLVRRRLGREGAPAAIEWDGAEGAGPR